MKNKIVFITSKDDGHSDHLIKYLNGTGHGNKVIRINTEDFATNFDVTFDGSQVDISIKDSGLMFNSNEVCSVLFRRPKDIITSHIDDEYTGLYIKKQFNAFLRGFYFCTHDTALWVNPLPSLHRARIKFQQLQLANKLNFTVPETIASNDSNKILKFSKKHKNICMKSLDEPSFIHDKYIYPLYTKIVSQDYIEKNLENIKICPVLLQQYIEKKYDIRVVTIGKKIFSFEIHSQEQPEGVVDFRGADLSNVTHREHRLPVELEDKILKYLEAQNLYYSSFDFVLCTDKKYYFIENNANGQWLWLEKQSGLNITEYYTEFLLNAGNMV